MTKSNEELLKNIWPPIKEIVLSEFPMGILKDVANVTYRQINDWESKGYFSSNRKTAKEWRSFNLREIFALQVANKLKELGVRPSKLKPLINTISKSNLVAMTILGHYLGINTYFYTDIESTADIMNLGEVLSLIKLTTSPSIIFCVNPLTDKLFNCIGLTPSQIDTNRNSLMLNAENEQDIKLLSLIKDKRYNQVIINKKGEKLDIKGIQYIDKNISTEIQNYRNSGKQGRITTHIDKTGKITNASFEEKLG